MSLLFKLFFKFTRLVNKSNNLSLIKFGFYLSSKKIQKIWFYVDEKKYNCYTPIFVYKFMILIRAFKLFSKLLNLLRNPIY